MVNLVVVAAPPEIASRLSADGVEVVPWNGSGAAPRPDINVWVAGYVVGRDADDIRASLATLPSLKVIQLLTAGVEPWPGVVPEGVTLCAGKAIHGGSTAELAVALTLSLVRELPTYAVQQADRNWKRHHPDTLSGKHVVVLGAGDIGRRAAATFETLDASVTLVSRSGPVTLDQARELRPDVLVVALPLTDATRGIVDAGWLGSLPDRAIVVNVARGPILDLEALTAEVEKGRLRAALDVTDPEPLPADHPLWTLPDVVITPHVGGGATGWEQRAVAMITDQLQRVIDGTSLQYVVTAGY